MYYVYVIESIKYNEIYIGYSSDLKNRIEQHNNKASIYTKKYAPWKLIYYEACINKKDATRREKYLKTSQGRRLMKRRLKEYFYQKKEN